MAFIKASDHYAKKIGNLIPDWLIALAIRIALFFVFWNAVQNQLYGFSIFGQHVIFWNVSDLTLLRFDHEYNLPFIPGTLAAYITVFLEFFLSIAILLGLFTRFSAMGLFIIVLVIQIFVYPGNWQTYLLWASGLLYLLRYGADKVSIDHLVR